MTGKELASIAEKIALQTKTLYVSGGWGQPATPANKKRAINQYAYNRGIQGKINAASPDTFFFDCVCLIKSILWNFSFNQGHANGGANYASNGVPDVGEGTMINMCKEVSTDFRNIPIAIGEAVWMPGHIGIYIGDGLAVECTPAWNDCVQVTAVGNIGKKQGFYTRNWVKHGKLPWVTYEGSEAPAAPSISEDYTIDQLAQMVISGLYGNGAARKAALGNRYQEVQNKVDEMLRTQKQLPDASSVVYTVQKGDYLGAIASRYNTTVERIVADNKIANKNLIHPGQKLIING